MTARPALRRVGGRPEAAAALQRLRHSIIGSSIALLAAALTACATPPPRLASVAGQTFAGRLVLRVDASVGSPARAVSAAFELRGDAARGGLDLSTPLGSVVAQARWAPGDVSLTTPGHVDRFTDLDALTQNVLGESIPVAALFDWLHGEPWAGAPSSPTTPSAAGPAAGFTQLGWSVDLGRFADASALVATRAAPPALTLRIQLEKP